MLFEVRNSADEVVGAFEFELDPNQERKINISSSTGGTVHAFMDSSPFIYVRIPSYNVEGKPPEQREELEATSTSPESRELESRQLSQTEQTTPTVSPSDPEAEATSTGVSSSQVNTDAEAQRQSQTPSGEPEPTFSS